MNCKLTLKHTDKRFLSMIKPIQKVLVANRGEIAIRIFRTLHTMGIGSVAIYSDADTDAAHVHYAKESYRLEGKSLGETYLDGAQIIRIALKAGVDAIHPGYGFLSESSAFSAGVRQAGLVFVGPGNEAIQLMGNKVEARLHVEALGIPVIKGLTGTAGELMARAPSMGLPLLVKAAAGGGGKGMRIVRDILELPEILETTQREAESYFGNGEVYIEIYLENPRHIEIQLMADQMGNVVCLFERECSIQRRYQKIIEEAPSPAVDADMRQKLMDAASLIATNIGYVNAGTIEFLLSEDQFYFLEMNTRIQVEHPVTEMITGIDIVKEQLRIANGNPLSFSQKDINMRGHAIEARVYAEDPARDFLPSPGTVVYYREPQKADIRIDAALQGPGKIKSAFDPMISKVIAYARTREAAREKLVAALSEYAIHGIKTNIPFLVELLQSQTFLEGNYDTGFCSRFISGRIPSTQLQTKEIEIVAASFLFVGNRCNHLAANNQESIGFTGDTRMKHAEPWGSVGYWRVSMLPSLLINNQVFPVRVLYKGNGTIVLDNMGNSLHFKVISLKSNELSIISDDQVHNVFFSFDRDGQAWIQFNGKVFVTRFSLQLNEYEVNIESHNAGIAGIGTVRAPMHGIIIKISIKEQDIVNKGDTLVVLESMKMENNILAQGKARVERIEVNPGDMVAGDAPLVILSDNF